MLFHYNNHKIIFNYLNNLQKNISNIFKKNNYYFIRKIK